MAVFDFNKTRRSAFVESYEYCNSNNIFNNYFFTIFTRKCFNKFNYGERKSGYIKSLVIRRFLSASLFWKATKKTTLVYDK